MFSGYKIPLLEIHPTTGNNSKKEFLKLCQLLLIHVLPLQNSAFRLEIHPTTGKNFEKEFLEFVLMPSLTMFSYYKVPLSG